MTRIESALKEVCESNDMLVTPDTPLREINGWDSMRAVTFQLELERIFSVDLSDQMISGDSNLNDIAETLRQKGAEVSPSSAH